MKLYFVRHAESRYNAPRIYQYPEVELSPYGLQQAEAVAKRFVSIPANLILSSRQKRARQTAEAIRKTIKKQIVFVNILEELRRPSEIIHKPFNDPDAQRIMELIQDHAHDPSWHYSDEENVYDLLKRAKQFLAYISKRKEESLVVVSHGFFIRATVGIMVFGEEFTVSLFERMQHAYSLKNTGITLCEMKEKNDFHLISWNDHTHL